MTTPAQEVAVAEDTASSRGRYVARMWMLLAAALAVAGFAAWQLSRSGTDPGSLARAYGFDIGDYPAVSEERSEQAPSHEGEKLGGGRLSLDDYRGKVVVLNLWGSWCGPCRREQPVLEEVWREYRSRGVQFLGVNERDQRAAALAFIDEFDVTYPSFFDDSAQLAAKLKALVLPTTYVVDRNGKLVFRLSGTVDEVLLRRILDGVLGREAVNG